MSGHFEKKTFWALSILWLFPLLSIFACQRGEVRTVEETLSDHPHRLPDTKVVGDYHVSFLVDHRRGEIEIFVTDAEERPVWLEKRFISGMIVYPSGSIKQIRFEPTQYKLRRITVGRAALRRDGHTNPRVHASRVPHSAIFTYEDDSLKEEHDFTIEVAVPIDGVIHKASFDFSTSAVEDQHHRHLEKDSIHPE